MPSNDLNGMEITFSKSIKLEISLLIKIEAPIEIAVDKKKENSPFIKDSFR